jgi:predicted metalloendopeptidase
MLLQLQASVLDAEEGAIGEILGQLFVKEYFNETYRNEQGSK